jgi:hypothetical protein
MTTSFKDPIRTTLRSGFNPLHGCAFIYKYLGNRQFVHIRAFIVLGVRDSGLEQLLNQMRSLLSTEGQRVQR